VEFLDFCRWDASFSNSRRVDLEIYTLVAVGVVEGSGTADDGVRVCQNWGYDNCSGS
jgi:hypothetical protein